MHFLSQMIGALVEAWGEVKVQKARVILSLVGVVAAVAAMSTVIALGYLTQQSLSEMQEAFSGRAVTLDISVDKKAEGGDGKPDDAGLNPEMAPPGAPSAPQEPPAGTRGEAPDGKPYDPIGDAMTTVADRFKIPYWSHRMTDSVELREYIEAMSSGIFRGKPVILPEWGGVDTPALTAVDPAYQVIYRLNVLHGRWIHDDDWNQRVAPVVLNEVMWQRFGEPNINDPILLHSNDDSGRTFRVVGVVKSKSAWDAPEMFISYKAWNYMRAESQNQSSASPSMVVWAGEAQASEARRIIPRAVAAVLGPTWEGKVSGGERQDSFENQTEGFTKVIMVIGAIVIFLGALGLLNVAIVTVRQRIREIGIRRAMGASAGRVFFAVFMESVVATFVAGVVGVGVATVVLRFIPLEAMGILLQDKPAFPITAAIIGVAISTGIGALCGIIPATAAVRVKPIDAIRY